MRKLVAAALGSLALVTITPAVADAAQRCPQYESLLARNGLPVGTFSRIMHRESNCRAGVRSRSRDTGLLQINDVNHRWLRRQLGAPVTVSWLKVPSNNVRAAAVLYHAFGTRPWATR